MASNKNSKDEERIRENTRILEALDLDELNGSPINGESSNIEQQAVNDEKKVHMTEGGQFIMTSEDYTNSAGFFCFRAFHWNMDDMNEEFILEIFNNANNNFLPDVFFIQNFKLREDITNLLNNFNFDNLNNDLMKTRHVESIFYNLKYFKNVEAITRENIFLKTSGSADFAKLKARFNTLLPLKKKYEKFSNFWKIYTVKFMENMSICLVNLEEAKAQRILLTTGKITLLFVSFQNIAKQKTNNVDISKEEFFLLGVNFICDLAELFNASVLLGCSANFDSLDDICVSWYPKGFKLISKGKDKHRQIPVDYFGCYHPNRFNYEFDITKMCRFGHREKYTPIYRYPHPIQLCDIVIKTKI